MDIFSFLNSRDIREHLKKINFRFSPFEAAWIIYDSMDATMEEKHAAWQELIDTTPDCELPFAEGHCCNGSLHRMLDRRMDFDRRMTEEFYNRDGCVYCAYVHDPDRDHGTGQIGVFETAAQAISYVRQEYKFPVWITVSKNYLNRSRNDMDAVFNTDGELMQVEMPGIDLPEADRAIHLCFEDYWLDFPTPFRKGDILCFRRNPLRGVYDDFRGPFVVERVNRDGFLAEYEEDEPLENRTGVDMTIYGYFQKNDGRVYELPQFNYMDCEFYRGALGGEKRALVAVQKYLRDEIPLDLLLNAYHHIMAEAEGKNRDPVGYADELKAFMKIRDIEPIRIWLRNAPYPPNTMSDAGKVPEGHFHCRSVNQAKNKILDCERKGIPIRQIDCFQDLGNYTCDGGNGSALLDWMKERGVFYSFKLHPGK